MKIARVFPRKTEGSPIDDLVFFGNPPKIILPELEEIHVSCSFTYDKDYAEYLADQWSTLGVPVKVGGPAYGDCTDENFVPGRYVKKGITFTSVGCPNRCWFCSVWKRSNGIKELPIKDGYIIQDDNIIATSQAHFLKVMEMLKRQKKRAEFKGGLEAKTIKEWHVEQMQALKLESMFFAYDTPDDYDPLIEAGKLLKRYEITLNTRIPRAYVLIGYPKDTMDEAYSRLYKTLQAGFVPFAMLYKNEKGETSKEWGKLQREWTRMSIICSNYPEFFD